MTPTRGPAPDGRGAAQREAFLAGTVAHMLGHGVATLSLRPLAAELGTSDRMLLYYFGTREQLLVAALDEVGRQLRSGLVEAMPAVRVPPAQLVRQAWAALQAPEAEPHLRLYVEVSGLTARGREPFGTAARAVARAWLEWVAERLDVAPEQREAAAAGVLGVLDGLLLLRFVVDRDHAHAAAGWLGDALDGPGHGVGRPPVG
jgi:AcrR family transcriptional regulator